MPFSQFGGIVAYSDASYKPKLHEDYARATYGYCIYYLGILIDWCSKRTTTVMKSTAEAEFTALSNCASAAMFYKHIISSLHLFFHKSISLLEDNSAAIKWTETDMLPKMSKHVDIHYLWMREHVRMNIFTVQWTPTNMMTADIHTKALSAQVFTPLCQLLFHPITQQ